MKKVIILFFISVSLLTACEKKEGYVTVQNKVHNTVLNQISWDNHFLGTSLLPGIKSQEATIIDKKESFPKNGVVKFYMQRGDNQVYLETKCSFSLDIDQHLLIVISDTTSVINPMTSE